MAVGVVVLVTYRVVWDRINEEDESKAVFGRNEVLEIVAISAFLLGGLWLMVTYDLSRGDIAPFMIGMVVLLLVVLLVRRFAHRGAARAGQGPNDPPAEGG